MATDLYLDRIEAKGRVKGEKKAALLFQYLFSQERMDDAKKAAEDVEFRKKLYREFGLE